MGVRPAPETPPEGLRIARVLRGPESGSDGAEASTLFVLDTDARDPDGLLRAIRGAAEAGDAAVAIPLSWLEGNKALAAWAAYPGRMGEKERDPWVKPMLVPALRVYCCRRSE